MTLPTKIFIASYGGVHLVTINFVQSYNSLNFNLIPYSSGRITLIDDRNISTRAIFKIFKIDKVITRDCAIDTQGLITWSGID